MTVWKLGDVILHPTSVSEFDYPQTSSLVMLLSDGTNAQNQVLQQGALPLLQCQLSGKLSDPYEIEDLRAYNASKEVVTLVDPILGSRAVRVLDFSASRAYPFLWQYDITLVEAVVGSGSGS